MLTYSSALSTLQSTTGVLSTDTTSSALLIQFWNDSRRTVAGINGGKWPWLEIEETVQTTADQEYVEIPNHINNVISVRQQNGSNPTDVIYIPRMVYSAQMWDKILAQLLGSSDVPYFCYQRNNRLYIQPIPSTTGNYVLLRGRLKVRDINIADYTAGTVSAVAANGTTVTGSGTTWTTSMAGRYIRITESDTANKGDGYWYEIASVASATSLTLKKPYQGTAIVAGAAAYTIGAITYEPEQWQMAPIYRALAQWWDFKENELLAKKYWMLYDGGFERGDRNSPGGMIAQMLDEANQSMEGPYISPSPRAGDVGQYAPYWLPYNDASGIT